METLLDDCKFIFDHSTLPFGIAEVTVDENNQPVDCIYRYINKPMEAYWTTPTENLIGKGFYEIWPNSDFTWRDHFSKQLFRVSQANSILFLLHLSNSFMLWYFRFNLPIAPFLFRMSHPGCLNHTSLLKILKRGLFFTIR